MTFTENMGIDGYTTDMWGSGPNDVYVCAQTNHYTEGRIYHFDGTNWSRITDMGVIPGAYGIWGSGPNDIWVGLEGGLLLHGTGVVPIPGTVILLESGLLGLAVWRKSRSS
jgi:hypothetical protein